jgi:hypothetical protein
VLINFICILTLSAYESNELADKGAKVVIHYKQIIINHAMQCNATQRNAPTHDQVTS